MCPRFSFVIDLTVINKENHFMLPPDLKVKLKFTFLINVFLGDAVVVSTAAIKTDLKLSILPCGLGL